LINQPLGQGGVGTGPSFEVRARLKEHRIPVYKAEPDLEVIVRFLAAVEHHVRLGGGDGGTNDAKHIGLAWTHLDAMLAYPWFVSFIGHDPYNVPVQDISLGHFAGCTWEAFKTAFKAQFGAQHAVQKIRQQLRDLKYNKHDVAGFHRRFLDLSAMLGLSSTAPYTDGIWMDYQAKLPPSLQQNLDSALMISNAAGQTMTLDTAIQLVSQHASRGGNTGGNGNALQEPATVAPHPDAMDLSTLRAEFNAMRSGGSQNIRCYGCGGTGHIRADCPSSGGGNSGAPGRERTSQPWRRGGSSQGAGGRGGRGGMRGGKPASGGSQAKLYATDTTQDEEQAGEGEAEADEEEVDSGVSISDEELLQWARDEGKDA
jgi:hypothetical protein